ncbi:excinuclease ABC subunit B [Puniceibacterium sediminis]|uniref:Excinuclease ABC subunit B n=1 Tax=Puniceibacterium sediminis TaxID=1608407 RepID=A0A238ZGI5_9RHOB|nr:excinuclease ABC subunit B [Puniceibacterium sediminis]SNR81774.1 hypothetical protein SAMN06265370_13014 [Puniceibacterium sediminis]
MDAAPRGVYPDTMRILFLIPFLALAACATPRQQCEANAVAPYSAALQERARISKELAQGYTYQTKYETRQTFGWCRLPKGGYYQCWDTDTQPVTRRVPVDAPKLEARLAELNKALPALRAAAAMDTEQCRVLFPEEPAKS